MSAPSAVSGALPVTGSGPFTLAIGLIGVAAIGVGSVMRRIARRDDDRPASPIEHGVFDLSSDLSATLPA